MITLMFHSIGSVSKYGILSYARQKQTNKTLLKNYMEKLQIL